MLLPQFAFHAPTSLAETCRIMAECGETARPIAGGTDLMVNMKKGLVRPQHVVSLHKLSELGTITSENGAVRIGSGVTVDTLANSELIREKLAALRAGARALGTPLIRNRATIGGNIVSARPAADLPPSLMVYGTRVMLESSRGRREVDLGEFFRAPGLTVMRPDELLTGVAVDVPGPAAGAGYINIGVRRAQDCNLVNVAAYLKLDDDGTVAAARIVMGCVGPTHLRAPSAEKLLVGEKPSADLFARAGEAASGDSTPILDFRGSAQYRRAMVGVLTRRTLAIAYKTAAG